MHGIIFTEIRKYIDSKLGGDAWNDLLNAAGLKGRMYLPIQQYPDAEAVALVATTAQITGLDAAVILEDFGVFLAPSLLGMYRSLVKPEWRTLDLLQHTEGSIYQVIRARHLGALPAELRTVRISATELHLTYGSPRKLCPVAKGIIHGMADHFGEEITMEETQCMSQGADTCELVVHVMGPAKKVPEKPQPARKLPARKDAAIGRRPGAGAPEPEDERSHQRTALHRQS